jgi:hypothetical protein
MVTSCNRPVPTSRHCDRRLYALALFGLVLGGWAQFVRFVASEEYLQAFSKLGMERVAPLDAYATVLSSPVWLLAPGVLLVVLLGSLMRYRHDWDVACNAVLVFMVALGLYSLLNGMMLYALYRYKTHMLGLPAGVRSEYPSEVQCRSHRTACRQVINRQYMPATVSPGSTLDF